MSSLSSEEAAADDHRASYWREPNGIEEFSGHELLQSPFLSYKRMDHATIKMVIATLLSNAKRGGFGVLLNRLRLEADILATTEPCADEHHHRGASRRTLARRAQHVDRTLGILWTLVCLDTQPALCIAFYVLQNCFHQILLAHLPSAARREHKRAGT